MELLNTVPDSEAEKQVKRDLGYEHISVAQARERLADPLTQNLVWQKPKELDFFHRLNANKLKELARFESESCVVFHGVVRELMNGEEMHKYLLTYHKLPEIDTVKSMIKKIGWVANSELEIVAQKIRFYLNYAVDTELLTARVGYWINEIHNNTVRRDEEFVELSEVDKQNLTGVFENNLGVLRKIVEMMKITMMTEDWQNSAHFNWVRADFVSQILENIEADDTVKDRYRTILGDRLVDYLMRRYVRVEIVKDSMKVMGVYEPGKMNEGQYLNKTLDWGLYPFLHERAKKTEVVRFLAGLEETYDRLAPQKLVSPKYYGLKSGKSFANVQAQLINWNFDPKNIEMKADGAWLNVDMTTPFKKHEIDRENKTVHTENIKMKPSVYAWFLMAHERSHHTMADVCGKTEGSKAVEVAYMSSLGNFDSGDCIVSEYRLDLYCALDEGLAILNEKIAIQTAVDHRMELKMSDDDIGDLKLLVRSRIADNETHASHYTLGYKLISGLYLDGYRNDNGVAQLTGRDEIEQRRKNGYQAVIEFLKQLDLTRITNNDSRERMDSAVISVEEAQNAGINMDRVAKVKRKKWIDGKLHYKEQVTEEVDRIELIDYIGSTDPAKRKLGQAKFLEMFGT